MSQADNKYNESLKAWIKTAELGLKHDVFVLNALKKEVSLKQKLIQLETNEIALKRAALKSVKKNLRNRT